MQTILGAGGAVGIALAKNLPQYTDHIRLVSRNPEKVNPTDDPHSADLLDATAVTDTVKGSEVVYLCAGLPYKATHWEDHWPTVMRNVLDACIAYNAKLVFFDNIYMYDSTLLQGMDEETPMRPLSKKGRVRKQLVEMIFAEVNAGKLKALIARSADFYGPGVKEVSVLSQTVIENLAKGKSAQILGDPDRKHSYTYIPDAGVATAILGNTDDAYDQVWHLPTAADPYTQKEWVEAFAKAFGTKPKYVTVGKFMLRVIGMFVPVMKEFVEMLYQYQQDYVFDSSKFEKRFGMHPTPYDEGIREIARVDYGIE